MRLRASLRKRTKTLQIVILQTTYTHVIYIVTKNIEQCFKHILNTFDITSMRKSLIVIQIPTAKSSFSILRINSKVLFLTDECSKM